MKVPFPGRFFRLIWTRLLPMVLVGLALQPWRGVAQAPPAGASRTHANAALAETILRVRRLLEPSTNEAPTTFSTTLKVTKAEGSLAAAAGLECAVALRAPDHLKLSAEISGRRVEVGRDGDMVWVHVPGKRFGVVGVPGEVRFTGFPDSKDTSELGPLAWPARVQQVMLLLQLCQVDPLPGENVGADDCRVFKASPRPEAIEAFKVPRITLQVWARASDALPLRLRYEDPKGGALEIELVNPVFRAHDAPGEWKLDAKADETIETVARGHLTRLFTVLIGKLNEKVPPLGEARGERTVVAREGKGRLERIDGTRVLFLRGTPEEMGRQQGVLLKKEVRDLTDHIVYGVGVGSSFEKGRWFFGEIEQAQKRLTPHINERYLREMDALADAAGMHRQEARLANFFPELFHCSGFALYGKATEGGKLYHGRILDYLRGMGLEQNAVVMVIQPDQGNAWVNVSYAGFVGSVTAMNEKHIAIGEMGGRGEGHWDGKPMAQLVREVMERANTLEEAVEIMRKGPRTCEYYYVISDGNTKRAVGVAATPDKFETIAPGQSHERLPHAIPDAVLMSAGDRYEELARRVQAGYGKIDAAGARDLMKRPVCMTSNIHSVLFEPETLDLWVANANSSQVAAHARFTLYHFADLLKPEPGRE